MKSFRLAQRELRTVWCAGAAFVLQLTLAFNPAAASPWAEVGDAQQRSDIELLAATRTVRGITTQWPLPWRDITGVIGAAADSSDPQISAAARRLNATTDSLDSNSYSLSMDVDSTPSFVRGFDAMGREKFQSQVSAEFVGRTTALRISVGAQVKQWNKKADLLLDGSYIAQKLGPVLVYAGALSHWWGPGWFSALSLSNNARPFPQIGIERVSTAPFESPWLSWIGPWQAEFIVGYLDGPRIQKDTYWDGLRISFSPLPGLEIGVARVDELCGSGVNPVTGEKHPCKPLATYFDFRNDPSHSSRTNDQGDIDLHYSNKAWGTPFEAYMQLMNEDTNPISHSGTSHVFGASIWPRFGDIDARLTAEYADSVSTLNVFGFGNHIYGFSYNDGKYPDGMRYRARALGFSLDDDSRLASVQLSLVDQNSWTYTLTFHHANVSNTNSVGKNPLTTAPVTINMGELRLRMPFARATIDLSGRYQDDQLRPKSGSLFAFEAALTFHGQ